MTRIRLQIIQGQMDLAIKRLETLLLTYSKNGQVWLALADAELQIGHRRKAEEHVNIALKIDPEDQTAIQLRHKIQQMGRPRFNAGSTTLNTGDAQTERFNYLSFQTSLNRIVTLGVRAGTYRLELADSTSDGNSGEPETQQEIFAIFETRDGNQVESIIFPNRDKPTGLGGRFVWNGAKIRTALGLTYFRPNRNYFDSSAETEYRDQLDFDILCRFHPRLFTRVFAALNAYRLDGYETSPLFGVLRLNAGYQLPSFGWIKLLFGEEGHMALGYYVDVEDPISVVEFEEQTQLRFQQQEHGPKLRFNSPLGLGFVLSASTTYIFDRRGADRPLNEFVLDYQPIDRVRFQAGANHSRNQYHQMTQSIFARLWWRF